MALDDTTQDTGEAPSAEPTQIITIQGYEFTAGMPYKEGDVLSKNEAAVINQTYGENLRNNFASRIKKAIADVTKAQFPEGTEVPPGFKPQLSDERLAELRLQFDAYEADYEFNGRRANRGPADPVEAEVRRETKKIVLQALKDNNIDVKTLPDGKLEEYISGTIERMPQIRQEVIDRLNRQRVLASQVLGVPAQ